MTWTVFTISLRRLLHSPVELVLTFVVPVAFFSVFALIFSKGVGIGSTPKTKVAITAQVDNLAAQTLVDSLQSNDGLRMISLVDENDNDGPTPTPKAVAQAVRNGTIAIGINIRKDKQGELAVDLLTDSSDQVAPQVVTAIVARELAMLHAKLARTQQQPEVMRRPSLDSPTEKTVPIAVPSEIHNPAAAKSEVKASTVEQPFANSIHVVDVMGEGKSSPIVSLYAAGIAVMFLLFGASGGGGAFLEERENTTLDRLLSTQMSMDQLLLGKWFYLTALGFVQVTVMFIWGQVIFGVDLASHLDGFIMMTIVTSGAAASFGLLLATLCKSRGQLNGLSVILILTMSALGGSMVPRYVMSDGMRRAGQWTFNAWALDGYDKVFWRELPVHTLWPQLSVLMGAGVGFLLVARALAVRWELE
ncbi:ABC transporter permease [Rhodopirellula sp. MGV]|uniref:ABC transporter permease n=1 Tax=Rhodopirellula sp. MGV TaxID=2023130 RepID=UPI000B95E4B5|nr:ABC transporter permease [Rhodopirellula sp. MGV]OYP34358.1 ABC transporter permease [Rhodopirellula sp. MGV]PNY35240.1 ABC transporter permease [Rhodopirellula baltica]